MSRKQVNFDVRVFQVTSNPAAHGGMTHEQVSDYVRTAYLEQGWEVLNSTGLTFDGNSVYVQVSLVKYEDVEEEPETLDGQPRRGRPRKDVTG